MLRIFDKPGNRYISHRGFQPMAPENSLSSFMYAGLLGQWAIETDVHVTADGMLVCCHDESVDSQYDGSGSIREMTWKELSQLRIKRGNRLGCLTEEERRMPLFEEYLKICREFGSVPFIETKTDDVERVIHAVRKAGLEDEEVVLSSSRLEHLVDTRRMTDEMFVHWIFAREEKIETLCELGNAGLSWNIPDSFSCPPEKIRSVQRMGLKVCLRAADSQETVRHMRSLGLDYLPTNCMHEAIGRVR